MFGEHISKSTRVLKGAQGARASINTKKRPATALEDVLELTDSESVIELTDSESDGENTAGKVSVNTKVAVALGPESDSKRTIKKLSDDVRDLTKETAKLKGMVCDVVKENRRMTKILMDSAQTFLNCGICTHRMWYPYILHKCGHTFCQDCLENWFHEIKCVSSLSTAEYTCPTCGQTVKQAPTKNLTLRDICLFITTANSEAVPNEPLSSCIRDPWLPFFPEDP